MITMSKETHTMSRIAHSVGLPLISLLAMLSPTATSAADVHRCQGKDGQLVFQDHPCDGSAAIITGPTPSEPLSEQQAARQQCEEWSQIGYLAAVARDAKQPQQQLLERYGRDGLDDGERAAIDWAYRESTVAPTGIKRDIRQDCLRERLQETNSVRFGYDPEKRPGEFTVGEQKFHISSSNPWVLDHTSSGKTHANIQLFATGGDPGRMHGLCRIETEALSKEKAEAQLRANALTNEADLNTVSNPVVKQERYADGQLSYISLPLRQSPGSAGAELKLPRYITHGVYTKGTLRCDYRAETYLPDGPAQRAAIGIMRSVLQRE